MKKNKSSATYKNLALTAAKNYPMATTRPNGESAFIFRYNGTFQNNKPFDGVLRNMEDNSCTTYTNGVGGSRKSCPPFDDVNPTDLSH